MPEAGLGKRFLIGTKSLMPFGQLFTLLCRNHEGGRKMRPLNGLQKSRCHENLNHSVIFFGRSIKDTLLSIFHLGWCERFLLSDPY